MAPPAEVFGEAWPDGQPLDRHGHALIVPEYARYARHVAQRLKAVMDDRSMSLRDVAGHCGIGHVTVASVLNGTALPDLVTLSRLETGLNERLWP